MQIVVDLNNTHNDIIKLLFLIYDYLISTFKLTIIVFRVDILKVDSHFLIIFYFVR